MYAQTIYTMFAHGSSEMSIADLNTLNYGF